MKRRHALVLAVLLVASGCGSTTPTAVPSPSAVAATSNSASLEPAPSAPVATASATERSSPAATERTARPSPSASVQPGGTATSGSGRPATGADSYDHVVLVVFENKGFDAIVGQADAPAFNRLIRLGTLSTGYRGIRHPSLPNYLALAGGSTFGVTSDCSPAVCSVHASNLGSLLSAHGRAWKAYL